MLHFDANTSNEYLGVARASYTPHTEYDKRKYTSFTVPEILFVY